MGLGLVSTYPMKHMGFGQILTRYHYIEEHVHYFVFKIKIMSKKMYFLYKSIGYTVSKERGGAGSGSRGGVRDSTHTFC